MNPANPQRLTVTVNPGLRDMVAGQLAHAGQSRSVQVLYVVTCLGIVAAAWMMLQQGQSAVNAMLFVQFMGLLLTVYPLVLVTLLMYQRRRSCKLALGPFSYTFDPLGMEISGRLSHQRIAWEGVRRIRRAFGFVLVMTDLGWPFVIPLRQVDNPHFFEDLRALAGTQTDFGPGQ